MAALTLLLLSGTFVVAGAQSARAEGAPAIDPREPAGYRALVAEGLREFDAAHFEEARALFLRAHAAFPNARTFRALGLAEFELRDYVSAANYLDQALRSSVRALDDKLRDDTRSVLERAYGFMGRVHVQRRPPDAQLSVDGERVALKADAPLLLRMGDHQLEAAAAGFQAQKQALTIRGGEELTLTFRLEEERVATAVAEGSGRERPRDSEGGGRWYKSPWLWVGVGIVVAGVAGGTAYALTRKSDDPGTYGGTTGVMVSAP